jgi:hypothetical protein
MQGPAQPYDLTAYFVCPHHLHTTNSPVVCWLLLALDPRSAANRYIESRDEREIRGPVVA